MNRRQLPPARLFERQCEHCHGWREALRYYVRMNTLANFNRSRVAELLAALEMDCPELRKLIEDTARRTAEEVLSGG